MARYDHLELVRLPERLERRKHGGGGAPPARDVFRHSTKLRSELDAAVEAQQRRRRTGFVDPALILRVQVTGAVPDEEWEKLGLTVLSSDADRTLVLFASNDDMQAFRARLDAYQGGPPSGQKATPYNAFVSAIEAIGDVEPRDRIGLRFREDGFVEATDFDVAKVYLVDVELWDIGHRTLREAKLQQTIRVIEAQGGEVLDEYIGPSITMLRARALGALIQVLLDMAEIASVDEPPQPDITTSAAYELNVDDVPTPNEVPKNAPVIGIIDSGVNEHPLLRDILVGAIGVPEGLGTADDWGHGTRVSGVAAYGDLRAQLAAGTLNRGARLCSAKVVNERGNFDDQTLVPKKMREAITRLHEEFGCRIFVVSLGDPKLPYDGGKVGSWAATLDELARELNVLIVVSSGNRRPRDGEQIEEAVTGYPRYLLEEKNRFFEPAGAMNVLTVGSLAHGEGLEERHREDVRVRPITRAHQPSPFSRVGPGIGGATKPDLVDIGGTSIFDSVTLHCMRERSRVPGCSPCITTIFAAYLPRHRGPHTRPRGSRSVRLKCCYGSQIRPQTSYALSWWVPQRFRMQQVNA